MSSRRAPTAELLARQAAWCRRLGSPLYGTLLDEGAADVRAGGPVWAVLAAHAEDPTESMLALRLMGAAHRLALQGRGPPLDAQTSLPALCAAHADDLRPLLARPVQTNEVARSGALAGGFLTVAAETGLPLRVLELGASAGLNLRWDRFRIALGAFVHGPPASAVRITGELTGGRPPDGAVEIAERAGCDPDPVDPATEDGRLTLLAYLWADQHERRARLEAALEVAREVPARVERAGAADWLEAGAARPRAGTATVVVHSVVLQYLTGAERTRVRAALAAAGAEAEPEAPFAHLALEPGGAQAELRLTTWPGGEERVLARCGFHGPPVSWRAAPQRGM